MSILLRIYREHAMELLGNPPKQAPEIDFSGLPEKAIPYVDPRVLSQNHLGFPLYLLMFAARFLKKETG
jgi:hypothetical protein